MARYTVPIVEGDIWTIRIVGIEDAPDHREKISESTLLQGCCYRCRAIAFTEFLAAYMRMSNTFVCGGRVWIQGNNTVRTGLVQLSELVQGQLNLKRPERSAI